MTEGHYTFTIIKPCAVKKELIGPVLLMINKAGFHIIALKQVWLSEAQAKAFYAIHEGKPFFDSLIEFMISGPVVTGILEKPDAVQEYRKLMGATNPEMAAEGTIRKLFGASVQQNAVHGSDSNENARLESDFFFAKSERFSRFSDLALF